ncbi:hypothetical protein [Pedobacter sp. N23S346]|uniref:hypothetical protein n=1 Tax=Pedobacter sp. N23S346 TaxID=3402750 RepID=UPI003AC14275
MKTKEISLADLNVDELYFKKREFKNDVLGLGVVMVIVAAITIILSIKAQNYPLIAVAICGLQPAVHSLTHLKKVNKEIKKREGTSSPI